MGKVNYAGYGVKKDGWSNTAGTSKMTRVFLSCVKAWC